MESFPLFARLVGYAFAPRLDASAYAQLPQQAR
jgi:hypothetical protein